MVALLSLSLTAFAAGSDYQSWVGIGINYNFQPGMNLTSTDPDTGIVSNAKYNPSVGGGIEVGYKMQNYGVRARYDYYSATGSMSFNNVPTGISISSGSLSGNVMDYYAQVMGFMPINAVADCYVGVGVGGLRQTATIGNTTITTVTPTPSTTTVAGETITSNCVGIPISVGGNYFFAKQFGVNVDLTYMISTNTSNVASYFTPQIGLKYTF
jgi:hypothetical protein